MTQRNSGQPWAEHVNAASPLYERLAQKSPKFADHPYIFLGPPMIILFDLIVPCITYYTWFDNNQVRRIRECQHGSSNQWPGLNRDFDRDILSCAIISFGVGELYILIARVLRLILHPQDCAPLLSHSRWELDATSWVYGVAMICALIPFVIGSIKELPKLYLYAPGVLMSFLGILMLVTVIPFKIPIGIDSQPRGTWVRPFVYYACEDFIAVDGLQDREFRSRYNLRYQSSKAFRRMMFHLTLWWLLGICIYVGCLSAIVWTLKFHFAFGLSLGVLFGWILIWVALSYVYFQFEISRQSRNQHISC